MPLGREKGLRNHSRHQRVSPLRPRQFGVNNLQESNYSLIFADASSEWVAQTTELNIAYPPKLTSILLSP